MTREIQELERREKVSHPRATCYIAAYDTELFDTSNLRMKVSTCLEACYRIVEVHHRYHIPATFFVVGRALEANPQAYRDLLDDPLFEIASHSYSHKMFRDHPLCGPAASPVEIRQEIFRGKEVVEQVFQRPCRGLRTGCGFVEGLRGAPDVLQMIAEAKFQYVSSLLRMASLVCGSSRDTAGKRISSKGITAKLGEGMPSDCCSSHRCSLMQFQLITSLRLKKNSLSITASSSTRL
jgi:hypothetical protein